MSKQQLSWSLLIALVLVCPAKADMGFPGFKRPKSVYNRITTKEDVSSYAFLIVRHKYRYDEAKRESIAEDEADIAEFGPEIPLVVSGQRRDSIQLYMIWGADGRNKSTAQILEDVKQKRTAIIFKSHLTFDESVPEWSGNEVTIDLFFKRRSEGTGFELIRTTWGSDWQCCVVCLAPPLALIFGGIWLARLLKRPTSPPPTDSRNR